MNKWLKKIKMSVFEKLLNPVQRLKTRQLKKQHDKKIKQLTSEYAKLSKTPNTLKRAIGVFLIGIIASGGLMYVLGFITLEGWIPIFKEVDGKPIIQLSNLIIVAPIAFIIWLFRDQNHLRALNNARKDTNLKEFQQLQEWATGSGEAKDNKSLQISALHSLRGYLKGEYGEDFRRGAFEIFASALHIQHQKILANIDYGQQHVINSIRTAIEKDELCKQLNRIVQEEWFNLLINHDFPTATISLVGVNLSGKYLQCKKYGTPLNLASANLQGASLINAQLQGTDLSNAQLQGASLIKAQLQEANLHKTQLQGANLHEAQLQLAYLNNAQLQGASLNKTQLQGASLIWARLQGANLHEARLQGANLHEARLQGANLHEAQLHGTNLQGAQLQGAYISYLFEVLSFEKRISQQTNKETETEKLIKLYKPLNNEEKQAIIEQLKKNNPILIKNTINSIQQAGDTLDLSKTKTGTYDKKQAQTWINEFTKSNPEYY